MTLAQYLAQHPHDLISPDGIVTHLGASTPMTLEVTVEISSIAPVFVGFQIDAALVQFNLKSALAQLGLTSALLELQLDKATLSARCRLLLTAVDPIAQQLLSLIQAGSCLGKLFAADDRRLVLNPHYLLRMFGRVDREGTATALPGRRRGGR